MQITQSHVNDTNKFVSDYMNTNYTIYKVDSYNEICKFAPMTCKHDQKSF